MMKNKLIALLLFTFFLLPIFPKAQQVNYTQRNHEIYWYLRERLKYDFMKVGIGQGMSIPGGSRYRNHGPTIGWGDATKKLGWYLAVLGTEYELLNQNNQIENLNELYWELYCALAALERLMETAPTYPPYNQALNNKGYFIRDDVVDNDLSFLDPSKVNNLQVPNYLSQTTNFNTGLIGHLNSQKFLGGIFIVNNINKGKIEYLKSDFMSSQGLQLELNNVTYDFNTKKSRDYEMSKDQVVFLLMGLKVLDKVNIGNGISFLQNGSSITFDFSDKIVELSEKIIRYVETDNLFLGSSNTTWNIKNPNNQLVSRGAKAKDYAFPFSSIAVSLNPNTNVSSGFIYSPIFITIQDPTFPSYLHSPFPLSTIRNKEYATNASMTCALTAITNIPLGQYARTTIRDLCGAQKYQWSHFYLLLNDFLFGNVTYNEIEIEKINSDLQSIPCIGPYFFKEDTELDSPFNAFAYHKTGWSAGVKYTKSFNRQIYGVEPDYPGNGPSGFQIGLDYMLFHNLVRLQLVDNNNENLTFSNLYRNFKSLDYVTSNSSLDPIDFHAIEQMTIDCNFEPSRDILLTSKTNIVLKKGFHAKQNTHLKLAIEERPCEDPEYEINPDYIYEESEDEIELISFTNIDALEGDTLPYDIEQEGQYKKSNSKNSQSVEAKSVIFNSENLDFNIFPNPTKGSFIIQTPELGNFKLFSTKGVLLKELNLEKGFHKITLEYSLGTYYYLFQSDNSDLSKNGKIIITL